MFYIYLFLFLDGKEEKEEESRREEEEERSGTMVRKNQEFRKNPKKLKSNDKFKITVPLEPNPIS
jgi:hypothetical protein